MKSKVERLKAWKGIDWRCEDFRGITMVKIKVLCAKLPVTTSCT